MEVLGFHKRLTLCCGAGVPLPVKDSITVLLDAWLTKDALSEAVPVAVGLKVTVSNALWPAAIVSGNAGPLRAILEYLSRQKRPSRSIRWR